MKPIKSKLTINPKNMGGNGKSIGKMSNLGNLNNFMFDAYVPKFPFKQTQTLKNHVKDN